MVVAGGFNFGDVLVVEEIEALGQNFQLAHFAEVELLGQAQVGLPRVGIAEGVAADVVELAIVAKAVDAVVAAGAVHARPQADDGVAGVAVRTPQAASR